MIIIIIYKHCNRDERERFAYRGSKTKSIPKNGRILVDRMTDVFIEINSIHTKIGLGLICQQGSGLRCTRN